MNNWLTSKIQIVLIQSLRWKNVKSFYSTIIQRQNHQLVKLKMPEIYCKECANLDFRILNDLSSMFIRDFCKMLDYSLQKHYISCFHVRRAFAIMIMESKEVLTCIWKIDHIRNSNGFIHVSFRNHILESLPYIGSTASVEMMAQEINKKSISDTTAQKWLTSLSFLPRYNFNERNS